MTLTDEERRLNAKNSACLATPRKADFTRDSAPTAAPIAGANG